MWLEKKTVVPSAASLSTISRSSRAPLGSSPGGGLIEDQQVGIADERHRQGESLSHPRREPAGLPTRGVLETDPFEKRVRVVGSLLGVDGELEVFAGGQAVVHVEPLREDAGAFPDRDAVCPGVASEHPNRPRVRPDEIEEDVDRRRLARAVRAEKAEYLALVDFEVDAAERPHVAEGLLDAVEFDGGHIIPEFRPTDYRP